MHPCQEQRFNCIALAPDGQSMCAVHKDHPGLMTSMVPPRKHWTERLEERQQKPFWSTRWDDR